MTYTIYSKPNCPQCDQAKTLMKSKEIQYNEIILDVGQEKLLGHTYVNVSELKALVPDAKSVPQIFKGDAYLGSLMNLRKDILESC